ncbi:putative NAD(P)/FAD-binding protein YdhS [Pelomonas saccharophila]|uniref:NAD(P)/FAD-binding protein YdhS n=1 Tax=Roseateles saccharophilus TaxID=304 RepID=A0ABU1YSQ7_ROSSA|nr:FAD/NAD(P)-binding protein [Roseateles saccharophilus]MDR7271883.1 putative NAD(P)/FAD-binding protein YdhS [Roseateles saccharophilus]
MHVAVVGSGFSGVAVAWQLLGRLPAGSSITMINGSGRFARGLAYGTHSADHLLNVPAARMSLDPAQPGHFVDWLRREDDAVDGHEFVSRQRYGDYLQSALEQRAAACAGVALRQRVALVDNCQPFPGGWQLSFADGTAAKFDAVILAIGHLAPRPPHPALAGLADYVADPWAAAALEELAPDAPVALIGSGLTMLDVLITLRARGHRGPVLALSRRGLLPQGHRRNEGPPKPWAIDPAIASSQPLRRQLRLFRAELARAHAAGVDWRDVWAAFRAETPKAWQALDARGRGQFLRHLLPYWDVHRHRAAPQARAVLEGDLASGRLRQAAGRVVSVQALDKRLQLGWRGRGKAGVETFDASCIVNCSGPSSAIDAGSSPLLWRLQQAGRLTPCAHGLGLLVDEGYRIRAASGEGQSGLHYIGPHLRAQLWEATAVPELREHAAALAAQLIKP